ncbi:MAG TPA: IPT/TIG domain-containing protein [Solirubrobacterales bacterium]|nr:IPT/TIG domain-containing protein [Solirubrobacterales bacterium]
MVTALASLALCASAQAGIVTVGSLATETQKPAGLGTTLTMFNAALGDPKANVTSPVTGTIVRWHVRGFSGGPFRLRVLTPLGGQSYLASGTSGPATPLSLGPETFPASLPIKAGQTIAVDNTNPTDLVSLAASGASAYDYFAPPLADGASGTSAGPFNGVEFAFYAEVLPLPGVSVISPTAGSIAGGTVVSIAGSEFAEVTGVRFGAAPATLYSVDSAGLIKAVAPPSATPGPVAVTVTTSAGTTAAGAGSTFTYTACVVPKLAGKKLKGAKKRIRKGGCRVGKVNRPKGVTAKTGVVVKQNPKAGKILTPGAKVNVKLGT